MQRVPRAMTLEPGGAVRSQVHGGASGVRRMSHVKLAARRLATRQADRGAPSGVFSSLIQEQTSRKLPQRPSPAASLDSRRPSLTSLGQAFDNPMCAPAIFPYDR